MFSHDDATEGSSPLTPEIIAAAVQYIRQKCKAKQKGGTTLYRNADGLQAMAEFISVILDHGWLCNVVSPTTVVMHFFCRLEYIYMYARDSPL